MYKIGDFSRITGITVKALRYYDDEDILIPSSRAENSYRYYDESDFERARLISLLRGLDFSIAEIKDVLSGYTGEDDLAYYLCEKRASILRRIESEQALAAVIDRFLKPTAHTLGMDYTVETKELDAIDVASIRFKGAYSEIGKYIELLYKEVGSSAQGVPFCCYYDAGTAESADIEVCVPVCGAARRVPGARALCTTHVGSYEALNFAYKAIVDYANERGVELALPTREIYIKRPGALFAGNPNKYVTEIAVPIEEADENDLLQ